MLDYAVDGWKSEASLWFEVIGAALRDVAFNVSHQMLAKQYNVLANDIPAMLSGVPVKEDEAKRRLLIHKILIYVNTIVPLSYAVVHFFWHTAVGHDGASTAPLALDIGNFVNYNMIGVLQIVSGIYLVESVLRIRRFMVGVEGDENIDTKMMLLHVSAYMLYLLASISYYGTYTFRRLTGFTEFGKQLFLSAKVFYYIANFIALVLLALILIDLGKADENENERGQGGDDNEIELSEIDDFDEEAELQVRIWNGFRRETMGGDDEGGNGVWADASVLIQRKKSVYTPGIQASGSLLL